MTDPLPPLMLAEWPDLIYHPNPHQREVLAATEPLVFLGGGVGTGKTDTGSLWVLHQLRQTPPGCLGLICANTYGQLFDSTLRNLYRNFAAWGVEVEPASLPRQRRSLNLQVRVGEHWVEVLCRSLETWESLSGIEVGWWWADETWQTRFQAIQVLQARLRDRRMPHRQALMTTTLDDPSSWMYGMFVERYNGEVMRVIYATTQDNAHNLPPGFIEMLKATYSARMYERMVLARWVAEDRNRVYGTFDRRDHEEPEVVHDPRRPVCWSLDFNIAAGKPMSSLLAQVWKGPGPDGTIREELHVFDEIVLETTSTAAVIAEFQARPWPIRPDQVIIYGDAAGHQHDSRGRHTDFSLLAEAGFTRQRVPSRNPPIRERHNIVNALLRNAGGDIRVRVHPRCKTLLKGLETVQLKPGAEYQEAETREQHITTALGYLIHQHFDRTEPLLRLRYDTWK